MSPCPAHTCAVSRAGAGCSGRRASCVREKPESAALQPSVTWRHCLVSDGARPGAEAPAPRHTGQRRRALPPGSVGSRVRAGRGFAAAGHLPGPAKRSHPDSLPHPCPGEPQGLSPRPLLRPRVHPLVPKPPRCSRSHGPLRAAPHCFPGSALGTSPASVASTGAIWGPSAWLQGGLTRLGPLPDGCSGRGWPHVPSGLPLQRGDGSRLPEAQVAVGPAWWHLCRVPLVSAGPRGGRRPRPSAGGCRECALRGAAPPLGATHSSAPRVPPCWAAHAPTFAAEDSSAGRDSP